MRHMGRATGLLVIPAMAATLAGCAATVTSRATPAAASTAAWSHASKTDRVGVGTAAPDLSAWWSQFNDATLSGLVTDALKANPDLRVAQTRLREARARRALAGQALQPSVDGSASGSTSGTTSGTGGSRTGSSVSLDASWEPDFFGSNRLGIQASQADLEATTADLQSTQVSLVAELALGYVDLRTYQARLAIAKDNLARQAETLQLTTWRAQAGLASDLDVEQSRANVEQTKAQIPTLETGIAQAKNRLAILTGRTPGALEALLDQPAAIPAAPARVVVGIPADTLRQRPDVRAAERRLTAESARLGVANASKYPSIRLSGSLGGSPYSSTGVSLADSLTGSLLAGLTAPIFNRAKIREQIEIQGAVEERALLNYESAILAALEDVENALVSLANVERRAAALTAGVTASRNAADLARNRYAAGLTSYQTVLDTERTVLSAEDSLKTTEAERTSSVIRLYKALGGGWNADPGSAAGTDPRRKTS